MQQFRFLIDKPRLLGFAKNCCKINQLAVYQACTRREE